MVNVGLFLRIEVKPGREEEYQKAVRESLPEIEAEKDTIVWISFRLGPTTFGVVDAFPGEEGRQAHLEAGKKRLAPLQDLLAAPPSIEFTDIVAAKLPK